MRYRAAVKLRFCFAIALVLLFSLGASALAAPPDFSGLFHWRNIGPYRGGRTRAISGVPKQPNVFYCAQVSGGVFKSTDYGRTWEPIFDDQSSASVGALAVAVSDPNVIYVGSGEGLHRPDLAVGNGLYKSTDAGKTWTHLGLRDGQQIAEIAVDPKNADHVLVAVAGHPYGPNEERGIFLSTDGGKNFAKTLYKDENIGGGDVAFDPQHPQTCLRDALGSARRSLGKRRVERNRRRRFQIDAMAAKPGSSSAAVCLTTSCRRTSASPRARRKISSPPSPRRRRCSFTNRTDAGASWSVATDDTRPAGRIGGGDLPVVRIDPQNPQIVYATSTVCWKSTDGGKTWEGWRGAPGGDDYQNMWISPNDSNVVALASDQGAIITVNGGATWSSWYNQSTAQLYHVSADNSFPYRLYSGQQESGSVGIDSRGPNGEITFRDWHPVGAEEYGYVDADPLDPEIVYGGKLAATIAARTRRRSITPKAFRVR